MMRVYKYLFKLLVVFIFTIFLNGCSLIQSSDSNYEINNIKIFKNTPAWYLAKAVKRQKETSIKEILERNPQIINYQESKYGATLLIWAIGMEKYRSATLLLELGANPNIATKSEGETPLYIASGFSWIDVDYKKDPKYVKLLLEHGADPNIVYKGQKPVPGKHWIIEPGNSPLMRSIGCGIEKTKLLIEYGAEINYKTKYGTTAAIEALLSHYAPEYAHYLIVTKKANIRDYYYGKYDVDNSKEKYYPVELLRLWVFALDSPEYKIKQDIIREFERQGIDYWKTEVPTLIKNKIKRWYPDSWREYINKY